MIRSALRSWLLNDSNRTSARNELRGVLQRGIRTTEGAILFGLIGWLGYQWYYEQYVEALHFLGICGAYMAFALSRMGAKQAAADIEVAMTNEEEKKAPTLAGIRNG